MAQKHPPSHYSAGQSIPISVYYILLYYYIFNKIRDIYVRKSLDKSNAFNKKDVDIENEQNEDSVGKLSLANLPIYNILFGLAYGLMIQDMKQA